MSAKEVLDIAVSKAAPSEPTTDYCLVLVTSKGGMSVSNVAIVNRGLIWDLVPML